MTRSIDYSNLMHRAMQGLIAGVLRDVAANGLPGAHHFFITFGSQEPGVEIADWMRERYPSEMTIVIQHWYEDLQVTDKGFEITLNFGNSPERMVIPFDAVRSFVDPSVEFGLRFDSPGEETRDETAIDPAIDPDEAPVAEDVPHEPAKSADVVSLDKFRK